MKKKAVLPLLLLIGMLFYALSSYLPEYNGIDVSHHNRVNWERIKKNEAIKFCYIKATEGNRSATQCVISTHNAHAGLDCT